VIDKRTLRRIKDLKKQYLDQVQELERIGHSRPKHLARRPKLRAYAILIERCGMKPMEAVEFFRKVEV